MSMWFIRDLYEYMGIYKNDATPEAIQKAYDIKAHELHPDHEGGSAEGFKELNVAYQVLSDPKKKQLYDNFRDDNGSLGEIKLDSKYEMKDFNDWIEEHQKDIKENKIILKELLEKKNKNNNFLELIEHSKEKVSVSKSKIRKLKEMIKRLEMPEKIKQIRNQEISELTDLIEILRSKKNLMTWRKYIIRYESEIKELKKNIKQDEIFKGINPFTDLLQGMEISMVKPD